MFFIPFPIVLIEVLIFSSFVYFYDFWTVLGYYLLPSPLGIVLFSMMGKSIVMSLQGAFNQGQIPGDKILHRGAILVGSVLLIIPMFLSRVLALLLILPIFRHISIFIFKTFIFKRLASSRFSFVRFNGGSGGSRGERDAEVVDITPIEITHNKIETEAPKKKDEV